MEKKLLHIIANELSMIAAAITFGLAVVGLATVITLAWASPTFSACGALAK